MAITRATINGWRQNLDAVQLCRAGSVGFIQRNTVAGTLRVPFINASGNSDVIYLTAFDQLKFTPVGLPADYINSIVE